jgi:hypothetical protein
MNKKYSKDELEAMRKIFLHNEIKDNVSPDIMKIFQNTRFEDFDGLSKLYRNSTRERMNFLLKDLNLGKVDIDMFYNFVNSDKYDLVYKVLKEIKNNDELMNSVINLRVEYEDIYSYEMIAYMLDVGTIKYLNAESDYYNILKNLNADKNAFKMRRCKFFEYITYCEETIKEVFGELYIDSDFYDDVLLKTEILTLTVDFKITLNDFITDNEPLKKALFHHSLSMTYFQNLCDDMNEFIEKSNRGENALELVENAIYDYPIIWKIYQFVISRGEFVRDLLKCCICLEGNVGILFHIYGFNIYIITRVIELIDEYNEYTNAKKKKKNTKRREVYKSKKKNFVKIEDVDCEDIIVSDIYVETDELTESLSDDTETTESLSDDVSNNDCDELNDDDEPIKQLVIHDKNINHLIFNRYLYINCVCKIRYNEKRLLRSCLNSYYDTNEKYHNFIRINHIERIDIVKPLHKGFTDDEHFNVIFVNNVNPKLNLTVFHVYLAYNCDGNMYLTTMTCIYNPFD